MTNADYRERVKGEKQGKEVVGLIGSGLLFLVVNLALLGSCTVGIQASTIILVLGVLFGVVFWAEDASSKLLKWPAVIAAIIGVIVARYCGYLQGGADVLWGGLKLFIRFSAIVLITKGVIIWRSLRNQRTQTSKSLNNTYSSRRVHQKYPQPRRNVRSNWRYSGRAYRRTQNKHRDRRRV